MTMLPAAPVQDPPRRSLFGGCLKTIGIAALALAVLLIVGLIVVWWMVSQSLRAPDPQVVPQLWVPRDVVLSSQTPSVAGTFTVSSATTTVGLVRLGVNVGAPAVSAEPSPLASGASPAPVDLAQAFEVPLVQLRVHDAAGTWTCQAPCELALPELGCAGAQCRGTFDVTLELEAGSASGPVTLRVWGGAIVSRNGTAASGGRLPDGFAVDLALGSPAAPSPSGGG